VKRPHGHFQPELRPKRLHRPHRELESNAEGDTAPPPVGGQNITTEAGDPITTEAGDPITTE
jgi:hypothetical protein